MLPPKGEEVLEEGVCYLVVSNRKHHQTNFKHEDIFNHSKVVRSDSSAGLCSLAQQHQGIL